MLLRARFAAIRWIRPGFVAPAGVATLAESIAARTPSICSGSPRLFKRQAVEFLPPSGPLPRPQASPAAPRTAATPLLRQPLPRDTGPVLGPKMRTVRAARCGTGRRPSLGGRWRWWQQRFDEFPQLIGDEFLCHSPTPLLGVLRFQHKNRFC
jgi:hypothetical protein